MRPIRVVVAVPNRILREGLSLLLEQSTGMEVVGSAGIMEKAVQEFEEMRPDVVLMAVTPSPKEALQTIARIRAIDPAAWIIGMATDPRDDYSIQAIRLGATTILKTDLVGTMLLPLIRARFADDGTSAPKSGSS